MVLLKNDARLRRDGGVTVKAVINTPCMGVGSTVSEAVLSRISKRSLSPTRIKAEQAFESLSHLPCRRSRGHFDKTISTRRHRKVNAVPIHRPTNRTNQTPTIPQTHPWHRLSSNGLRAQQHGITFSVRIVYSKQRRILAIG